MHCLLSVPDRGPSHGPVSDAGMQHAARRWRGHDTHNVTCLRNGPNFHAVTWSHPRLPRSPPRVCLRLTPPRECVTPPPGAGLALLSSAVHACPLLASLPLAGVSHTFPGVSNTSLGVPDTPSGVSNTPPPGAAGLAMLSSAVHACPLLASLHLAGNNISSEGAWSLAAVMPDLKALTELDISNNVQLGETAPP